MATMMARFSGTCATCAGAINVGDQIDWDRDTRVTHHARCVGARAKSPAAKSGSGRKPPRKPAAPHNQYREPRAGEVLVERRRGSTFEVGTTIHMKNIDGGGGPDGRYWTVTHAWYSPRCEDNQQFDNLHCAYVVPATDEQVAPVLAAIAERSARPACERWLVAALAHGAPGVSSVSDTGSLPPAADRLELAPDVRELVLGRTVSTSGAVTDGGTKYVMTSEAIVAHHGGYYDDYRSSTRTLLRSIGTEQLESLLRALATNDTNMIRVLADRARELETP